MAPDEGTKPIIIVGAGTVGKMVVVAHGLAVLSAEAIQALEDFENAAAQLSRAGLSASSTGQCLRNLVIPKYDLYIKDWFSDFDKNKLGLGETVPVKEFFVVLTVLLIIEARIRSPGALKIYSKCDLQKT